MSGTLIFVYLAFGGATDTPVRRADLGVNFFLTEADLDQPRAQQMAKPLQEMNGDVRVSVHEGDLTEEVVGKHDCVIFTTGTCLTPYHLQSEVLTILPP